MSRCSDPELCLLKPTKSLLVLLVLVWVSEDKNVLQVFIFHSPTAGTSLSLLLSFLRAVRFTLCCLRQHTHEAEEVFHITATADFI